MNKARKSRIGETFTTKEGCCAKIVNYVNNSEVYIIFDNCTTPIKCQYSNLRRGNVKNPYHPSICGVGYLGIGSYTTKTLFYKIWTELLRRCYDEKTQKKNPTYIGCTVCKEWHNFQNFAKWCEENYYEVNNEQMCLDKDILVKGNKIYSSKTCMFVPQRINKLFTKNNVKRGALPIGVSWHKGTKKYVSTCHTLSNKQHLGYYNSPEEAFNTYKQFKECYIKQVAEQYKDKIPKKLYNSLVSYYVETND